MLSVGRPSVENQRGTRVPKRHPQVTVDLASPLKGLPFYAGPRAAYRIQVMISCKPATDTGDEQCLKRRLCYDAEGAPDGLVLNIETASVWQLVGYAKQSVYSCCT
jgi:hypothetical protein